MNSVNIKMDEVEKVYVIATYPNSDEKPMGLTIKGNTKEYIHAHLNLMNSIVKGKTFTVNNDKFKIAQTSKKKGVVNCTVVLNGDDDETGKAELKVYEPSKSKKKGATIEIRKLSDFEFSYVEKLSCMITALLDQYLDAEEKKTCSKSEGVFCCDICKWETKSEAALKRHNKSLHVTNEQSKNSAKKLKCEDCTFETTSKATLIVHTRVNHKKESVVWSKVLGTVPPVAKKRLASSYLCSKCNSTFKTEGKLEEHMQTQHERSQFIGVSTANSPSSSPPRKRADLENDSTEDKEKADRNEHDGAVVNDREMIYIRDRLVALEVKHKEFEVRINNLMQQRQIDKETSDKLKDKIEYLERKLNQGGFSEVKPEHIPHLKGFRFFQKAIGNGRCLENCLALKLFQNQDKAVDIKRKLNTHMADHWDPYYTNKITFPFHEKVGVGEDAEEVIIENAEEMKVFLRSDKSLKAYSNIQTLIAMANLYKINIHIFSFKEEKSNWYKVCPDPDFVFSTKVKSNVRDMFLYHSYDDHYDLLVNEEVVPKVDDESTEDKDNIENIDLVSKDIDGEELLEEVVLSEDVVTLEEKNIEEHTSKQHEFICIVCHSKFKSEEELLKHKSEHEFSCTVCDSKFVSKEELVNHKSMHEQVDIKCCICERNFKTKIEMKNHVTRFHKDDMNNISCSDCVFKAKTVEDLNEHLSVNKHKVSLNRKEKSYERCYTCDLAVDGYLSLMDHRKEYHPSNKKCKNFANGICQFGVKCWYVHEEDMMDTDDSPVPKIVKFECYVCGSNFPLKDELKKHRKRSHPAQVKVCEKYLDGTCIRNNDFCWYKHENNVKNQPQTESQNFPNSQPQALPPECLVQMMEALEGLGSKVENFKLSIKNLVK